jgi:integrase
MKTSTKSDRITLNELQRLTNNLDHSDKITDKKIRIALVLQYYTSLRYGDCTKITFEDILMNNKFELIEEKTGKRKIITVNPTLKKEVEQYQKIINASIYDNIINFSIQYANRKLKEVKVNYNIKNYTNDSKFQFSTHSVRKCSLYEIYRRAGINVSLKISQHNSIDTHLTYICANEDIKDAYLCL